MTPVDQTIFENATGNCLAACVASVLNLPIETVPNFAELDFFIGLRKWLAERDCLGLELRFSDKEHCAGAYFGYPGVPVVMWGTSPRRAPDGSPKGHAVVGMPFGYGCKLLHDPHPSRAGLDGPPFGIMWIVSKIGVPQMETDNNGPSK